MPNCPQCGQYVAAEEATLCASCERNAQQDTLPVQLNYDTDSRGHRETLEAEIIHDNEDAYGQSQRHSTYGQGHGQSHGQGQRGYWQAQGRQWQQNGAFGQASRELSCLPALITLALGISLGIQWGFLASLGFFFFYVLGSAVALGVSVRRTLLGKPVLVWFNRLLVWFFAYAVAYSLAT